MDVILSIVIANYNYGQFLETAIKSVVDLSTGVGLCKDGARRLRIETGEYVELIVCDAGSHDNSVEIIKRYEDDITWWCSEKDDGQSDAFNKGFSHATGKFLTWLNADDCLMPDFFKNLGIALKRHPSCDWFAGGCVNTDPDLRVVKCTRARRFSRYEADGGSLCVYAPSSVFSKDLFQRVGGINVKYKGAMDTHLWYKFYRKSGVTFELIPGYIFAFRYHEKSRTTCNRYKDQVEDEKYNRICREFANDMEMLKSEFPALHKIAPLGLILHFDWLHWLISKIDTLRYKGKCIDEL